jgi:unsaturated chondroitin disaccharide hydrolase
MKLMINFLPCCNNVEAVKIYHMHIDPDITPDSLKGKIQAFWEHALSKTKILEREYDPSRGSPVFTVEGKYTPHRWTEWTQGFRYGIPLLVFRATGEKEMLDLGKKHTFEKMANHLTHFGVHDHGFNNLSTYGHLLQAAAEGLFEASPEEMEYYRLAIRVSGAVQARRWTRTRDGGFIHSFNGPHSLFVDTLRSCRVLLAAHLLGHRLLEENNRVVELQERAILHALATADHAVYYGEGRDIYDARGRVAHESIFNTVDGSYRCPGSQQGYSGFSTWTRGLAWAMLGFSELLEYMDTRGDSDPDMAVFGRVFVKAARATCDYYMEQCAADGIPYWDTGAPSLHRLDLYHERPADPFNAFEPVDSSAAAIGAQGLLRLGKYLEKKAPGEEDGYFRAGLTILRTLLSEPYLSTDPGHQGLLLHSVYHRPNGWDHIPAGRKVPCGESGMWGDYHLTELCFLTGRISASGYYTFFDHMEAAQD